MPTALQSKVSGNVQNARLAEIKYAISGLLFSHSTDAGTVGLHRPGKLSRKAVSITDAAGRDIVDQVNVMVEADSLQASLANFKNAKILSSQYHQLRVKDDSGKYFNFIDFAGTFGTPTASHLVGMNFEFTIGQNERFIKYTWETNMANTVWDWVLTNSGSAQTGATGGTSGQLSASTYARTSFKRSNIKDITGDAVSFGVIKDPKLTWKSVATNRDQWNRPLCRKMSFEGEVTMLQTTANDMLGISTTMEQLDKAIVITTAEDETITFAAGAISAVGEFETGDENAFCKVIFKGEFPYSDTAITINSSDATFNLVGM